MSRLRNGTLAKTIGLLDRKARVSLALMFVAIFVGAILEAAGVGTVFPFIKVLQDPAAAARIPVVGDVLVAMGLGTSPDFVGVAAAALFGFFLFKNVFILGLTWMRGWFQNINTFRLETRMLGGYMYSPYTLHLDRNSAEILRNLHHSVANVFSSNVFGYVEILTEALTALAILAILVATDPVVTLGVTLLVLLCFGLFFGFLPALMRRYGRRGQIYAEDIIKAIQQSLGGVKEIKVLGREAYFEDSFRSIAGAYAHMKTMSNLFKQAPRHAVEVTMVGAMLGAIYMLSGEDGPSSDLLAVLGVFAVAAYRLIPSANRIVVAISGINYGRAAVDDVFRDHSYFRDNGFYEVGSGTEVPLGFAGSVVMDGLSYSYPGAGVVALTDLNLTIERGQSVGIVGRSGAGKTTLVDVLLGVLSPTAGRLLVDGVDIAADVRPWQRNMGYVPQDIYLIDDTIRRNIAFGRHDHEIDEAQVLAAVRAAHLEDFIATLADGLDTVVGEDGVRLSGGQRQRIGIARALYHDPEVLVFDEATASLDNETERQIAAAIDDLRGRKTIVIIAHRLSTVRRCDNLILLKDGRLAGTGSFDALLAADADFRAMVRLGSLADDVDGDAVPAQVHQPA